MSTMKFSSPTETSIRLQGKILKVQQNFTSPPLHATTCSRSGFQGMSPSNSTGSYLHLEHTAIPISSFSQHLCVSIQKLGNVCSHESTATTWTSHRNLNISLSFHLAIPCSRHRNDRECITRTKSSSALAALGSTHTHQTQLKLINGLGFW
jgi:hypothetical protein